MDVSSPGSQADRDGERGAARAAPKRKAWKGAEILVEYLIKEKVPYLFGVCGHGNIAFSTPRPDAASRIKTISVPSRAGGGLHGRCLLQGPP